MRKYKTLLAEIEKAKKRIAAERDKLEDLICEAEGLREDADDALNYLENAVEVLSRQV